MKMTPTAVDTSLFPEDIKKFMRGADIYDSSCSPEARVYFIDKDEGYFLKCASRSSLKREAELDGYFHTLGLGPRVLLYTSSCKDFLLTERVRGEDLTDKKYLSEPRKLAETLGRTLRNLHEVCPAACPVQNRTEEYIKTVGENFRRGLFDTTFARVKFNSPDDAYRIFLDGKDALKSDVLIHGDYCLPNIVMKDWQLSSFIDLGCAGVADRHIDIFWGAWTLNFNLSTDEWRGTFYDAYGRDKIDTDLVELIGIAECFA